VTSLFLLWQEPESRRWRVVAELDKDSDEYVFRYTRGADRYAGFIPFGRLTDIDKVYRSKELFPIFANRILAAGRPETADFLEWLDLGSTAPDPIDVLARSGGQRATDRLLIYPKPARTSDNRLRLTFFAHGLRHAEPGAEPRVLGLSPGDRLFPLYDVQNSADPDAVALRSQDPAQLLGYVPRVFARDVKACVSGNPPERAQIAVRKVNPTAPLQFRLLCRFEADWPAKFDPCGDDDFQPRTASVVGRAAE
jgi:hypothetical protein